MSTAGDERPAAEGAVAAGNGNAELANNVGAEGQEPQQQQPQNQPTRMESFFAMTKSLILRALIIYFVSSFFRKPQTNAGEDKSVANAGPKITAWNYFENGTDFDLHVWLSEEPDVVNFQQKANLLWLQEDLTYGDWSSGPTKDGIYSHNLQIKASQHLMNNGSVYLHAFVTRSGESPDPKSPNYARSGHMGHQQHQLNKFKKLRVNRNYNLLASEKEKLEHELKHANLKDQIVSHWHPNLTVNLVVDQTNWAQGSVPPPLDEYVKFVDGDHSRAGATPDLPATRNVQVAAVCRQADEEQMGWQYAGRHYGSRCCGGDRRGPGLAQGDLARHQHLSARHHGGRLYIAFGVRAAGLQERHSVLEQPKVAGGPLSPLRVFRRVPVAHHTVVCAGQ
ncbi:cleft lip and palate transmembrane protein 1 homolog isoform X2 [Drosophila persimilis]|uniref:cleft lip and palate transmembrane protein 1 homolog isoform X2 n=1 Tax=Drosophila persimilis TaxID=7234 RepID=UPI000F075215|nr:cleft lip and palate transmembrane protein 1 homolog isoform X2 [Drosophila persimilis]